MIIQQHPYGVQPKHTNRGFTLIETLFAMLVFSIGIMAVMTLTLDSMNGFIQSGITTTEVNRTTLNIESLKQTRYEDGGVFRGVASAPVGTDGFTVGYNDANNMVVMDTKLITIQNNAVRGIGVGGNYELYYVKPVIQ